MKRAACLFIISSATLVGCGAGRSPNQGVVPEPNPLPKVSVDVDERMKQARTLVGELTQLAQQMPANDDAGERKVMGEVFDRCAKLLPMLMGPEADGQFRLQQRIVADARDQMGRNGERLAVEPMIDSGLRATYNALVNVDSLEATGLKRVLPGNPANSYLVRKLEGTAGIVGERMPFGGPYLSSTEINQVRDWIQAGALQ